MSKRDWYARNREAVLAQKRAQYEIDKEAKKASSAAYRAANPDKLVAFERKRWAERKNDADYRAKQAERARAWYRANRERVIKRVKKHRLASLYGLSLEQFEAIRLEQGGGCAICARNDSPLVVDHCHSTGAVRGLLCDGCNTAIGRLGDNAESVSRALAYLMLAESCEVKHA